MRTFKRLTGVVFALCMAVAGASTASAAVLVSTGQTNNFLSLSEYGYVQFQPFAEVLATSNVNIGGFGVYGRAEADGKLAWVVFDGTTLLTPSPITANVSNGSSGWFDTSFNMALQAGHTYTMGVAATDLFAWGRTQSGPTSQNGLTILRNEAIVGVYTTAGIDDSGIGIPGGSNFTGFERIAEFDSPDYLYQGSVRVFDAGGALPPVPEPSEWAMLLAGLMVVGFVAKRQRRRMI